MADQPDQADQDGLLDDNRNPPPHPLQPPNQQQQNTLVLVYTIRNHVYYPIQILSYTLCHIHTGEIPLLQIGFPPV